MDNKLSNIIKSGNIVIPLYLLQNYKELGIELKDFVFIMYLYNKDNLIVFNPNKISEDLGITIKDVMEEISILSDKHLIEVKVIKNRGVSEEVISLDLFYQKTSLMMMGTVSENANDSSNNSCFDFIEKEFGRTLSPMEYEIIKAWIEGGNSDEIIEEAVREAIFNGVNNLRYIDKILYEWNKKGIKTRSDVEKNRKNFRKKEETEPEEIFDYNWFEDEDE